MEDNVCPVCKEVIADLHHNGSVNHRYHFSKWSYNKYKKALRKNRHGISLVAEPEGINNFQYDFRESEGKYTTKVSPQQLWAHNKMISFKCTIKNSRKDPIYIVNTNLLHSSIHFMIIHSNDFGKENTFLKLRAGWSYTFKVVFTTRVLTGASYKIPLSCGFQTEDSNKSFTIVRSFLMVVDEDASETQESSGKRVFTRQEWKEVTKTIPSYKENSFLDRYPIPNEFTNPGIIKRELKELGPLTKKNYKEFWHRVLWMEEMVQNEMLEKYNMQEVNMTINDEDLILEVPGLQEKRPSIIVGDYIKIRISGDHTAYRGFVSRVNDKTIEISHVDEQLIDYLNGDQGIEMDVSFIMGRLPFERMHAAVDKIVETNVVDKLFPPPTTKLINHTTHHLENSKIVNQTICNNREQKNAVMKILNCMHNFPYIVYGPPGTGKSITIIEAIIQLKKRTKKKILVCAPANSACDMLATKLIPHCGKEELIRIHSSTRERTTITEELKEYSNMDGDEFIPVIKEKVITYRIVVTTLTLIGKFANSYHPDCVFIDEAAQASEPEANIAISLLTDVSKQVVLAGDHQQLGPMASNETAKFGFGISLLERLIKGFQLYQPNAGIGDFITMLKLNFRSHPDILTIPNKLFYDGELEPRSLIARRDPIVDIAIYPNIMKASAKEKGKESGEKIGRAIEFCSVSGKEKREGSSPSYFNPLETQMVVKYVKALISLQLPEACKVRADQIGVVTPYKRQVYKIKESLKHDFEGVEVGTTESFQGREKRIIIISTVRAQHSLLLDDKKYNLGFVEHNQRFNVALTRAITKLIVVGNPLVLRTDTKWKQYMDLCEAFGTSFGNYFPSCDELFKEEVITRMKDFKSKDDQYKH